MKALEVLLETMVDVKNGLIVLTGEVNQEMYLHLSRSLMVLGLTNLEYDEIKILINTYGGDLYQALAIYDLIRRQPMKTITQCVGLVMSAGTIILQAGDERLMTPRSYLMYHFGSQTAESSQCVAHYNDLTKDMKEIYKERSQINPRVVNSWFSKDTYYTAKDALKYGLIDRIAEYESKEDANGK